MRHKERQINDPADLNEVIKKSEYAVFAMLDGDKPYVVPLNFAWDGEYFYAHSGRAGKKLELLAKNPEVQFCMVPQAEFVRINNENACYASMRYESVIVSGRVEMLSAERDPEAHERGLRCITDWFKSGPLPFTPEVLKMTVLLRIKPTEIIGKRHAGGE